MFRGDVEKSLPPREETLIEVEMTSVQKQYYRAVFERNVDFLAGKDKTKKTVASLMNVAMQLRKVSPPHMATVFERCAETRAG